MAVPSSVGDVKYRGPLGRMLHSNRCHLLKIKVILFYLFYYFFKLKLWKGLGSPVIHVTVKKDSLLEYGLNFYGILAGRVGSVW